MKDHFSLSFEDTGIGISEDELPNIFTPFFRANEVQAIEDGLGIGLTLAQKIMRNLNGEIEVSSVYGKGTIVTLIFPSQCVNQLNIN